MSHRYSRGRGYRRDAVAGGAGHAGTWIAAVVGLGLAGVAAFLFKTRTAAAATKPAQITPTPPAPKPAPAPSPTPPSPPPAPPVPTTASLAKVLTRDPPPGGDLRVFDRPNGSQIGGAEKDSIVNVISNDGTFAQVKTNNTEGRLADVTGFVHAKFLGDPSATVAQNLGDAALAAADALKSALGF